MARPQRVQKQVRERALPRRFAGELYRKTRTQRGCPEVGKAKSELALAANCRSRITQEAPSGRPSGAAFLFTRINFNRTSDAILYQ